MIFLPEDTIRKLRKREAECRVIGADELADEYWQAAEELERLRTCSVKTGAASIIGQRREASGNVVVAVGQIDGWVFVMPERGGRPYSIAYAAWMAALLLPARAQAAES